ncbi:MAG: hypothetical protein IJ358_01515, partial [Clostridia bacterium]|nr:hypothetical protein [Clostridia bacterium]
GVSETPQSVDLQNQSDEYFHLYENIYYKVSANHEYGTQVVVTVFVLKPMDRTQQYYVIDSAYLNDAGLTINYDGEGELNGIMGDCYTFTYDLKGDDLPTELKLDVNFKALYYVELQ